jgi:hypothetical protein
LRPVARREDGRLEELTIGNSWVPEDEEEEENDIAFRGRYSSRRRRREWRARIGGEVLPFRCSSVCPTSEVVSFTKSS